MVNNKFNIAYIILYKWMIPIMLLIPNHAVNVSMRKQLLQLGIQGIPALIFSRFLFQVFIYLF